MKNITIIPATIDPHTRLPKESTQRRRVAAYARVSTDSEEQLTSYEAQVDYYTRYIQSRPDWEFVGVYADEGISATNTKRRESFNRMVQDALDGKIDLIVTKSVSRFARNTVDSLTTVRKLKEKGVEVYFQKENISIFQEDGSKNPFLTIFISVLGTCAEMERENIKFRLDSGLKRFKENGGKVGRKIGSTKSKERKQEEYAKVIRSLRAGKSIRDTAMICSVSISTVQRIKKEFEL